MLVFRGPVLRGDAANAQNNESRALSVLAAHAMFTELGCQLIFHPDGRLRFPWRLPRTHEAPAAREAREGKRSETVAPDAADQTG